jgi:predicted acyltransferase
MAGVAVSVLYAAMAGKNKDALFWLLLIAFGVFNIIIGFASRPLDGISKIHDTPSWVGICSGIAILVFALMIYLVDIKEHNNWFKAIRPGGTNTLTCYLIPYILYSLYELLGFHFPQFLNEGWGGFIRSFATAFVVIWIAGILEKRGVRMKI